MQVINAGVPGYSSFDARNNYVYQLRRLDPDMILVYHSWNDIKYFRRVESEGMAMRGASGPVEAQLLLPLLLRLSFAFVRRHRP